MRLHPGQPCRAWALLIFLLAPPLHGRGSVTVWHETTDYESPGAITVHCSIDWTPEDPLLALQVIPMLPAGWVLVESGGDGSPEWHNGAMLLTGMWPAPPLHLSYVVAIPEGQSGTHYITNLVEFHCLSMDNPALIEAAPAPLPVQRLPRPTELEIRVEPAPVAERARWALQGTADWHEAGQAIQIEPGTHRIVFEDIEGWTAPPPLTVVVSNEMRTLGQLSYLQGDMLLIPGGSFPMGWRAGEDGHHVVLDAFYMDRAEVTVADFAEYCEAFGLPMPEQPATPDGSLAPVVRVDWWEASAYAAWRQKRLPTEAQWEYAARGGQPESRYPTGDTVDPSLANYDMHVGHPLPAGNYEPNAYGLLDMAGNVWEWCADWFETFHTGPVTNPAGPPTGTYKVIRGGSYASGEITLENALRYSILPDARFSDLGFRCVAPVPPASITYHDITRRRSEVVIRHVSINAQAARRSDPRPPPDLRLQWTSNEGCLYSIVRHALDPSAPGHIIAENLPATPPLNSYTLRADDEQAFFIILEHHPTTTNQTTP